MGSGKGKTRRAKSAANIGQAVPGSDVDPRGAPMLPSGAPDYHIKDFSTGFCHLFALALHERYGWKLRALGEPEDEYSLHPWGAGMGSSITHVYCLNKQGLPVDVNGTFASEEAIQHFYTHELEPDAKSREETRLERPRRDQAGSAGEDPLLRLGKATPELERSSPYCFGYGN